MNKKHVVIILLVLLICFLGGYYMYHQKSTQKEIDQAIGKVENIIQDFTTQDIHEEKIAILQSLQNELDQSKEVIEEVEEKYHTTIHNMQKTFKKEYDQIIQKNTFDSLNKVDDKAQLETAKRNLQAVLNNIQKELDIVSNKEEIKKYETKINSLIKSYEKRLATMMKSE